MASFAASAPKASAKVSRVSRRAVVDVSCRGLFGRPGPNPSFNKYEIKRLNTAASPAPTLAESPTSRVAQKFYSDKSTGRVVFQGVHHVALLTEDLERSLDFYQGILGLEINPDRPHSKLPYRGAWLWIGPEMIHLMELPNPDPLAGRPDHGGRDRHFCVGVASIDPLVEKLEAAGIPYTKSMSGRPALFFRDPDMNTLEVVELDAWR